jgi:pSer/pThr/pTyr-binding forkhead associated (FHA) protein
VEAFLVLELRVIPIETSRVTIGRNLENTVVLSSPAVSRQHAEIVYRDGVYYLQDLNSTTGTMLNHQKIVQATPLQSGVQITIADVQLAFFLKDDKLEDRARRRTSELPKQDEDPADR